MDLKDDVGGIALIMDKTFQGWYLYFQSSPALLRPLGSVFVWSPRVCM